MGRVGRGPRTATCQGSWHFSAVAEVQKPPQLIFRKETLVSSESETQKNSTANNSVTVSELGTAKPKHGFPGCVSGSDSDIRPRQVTTGQAVALICHFLRDEKIFGSGPHVVSFEIYHNWENMKL